MFFDLQLYLPLMGIFSFVVQDMIEVVCFIKGGLNGLYVIINGIWLFCPFVGVVDRGCRRVVRSIWYARVMAFLTMVLGYPLTVRFWYSNSVASQYRS